MFVEAVQSASTLLALLFILNVVNVHAANELPPITFKYTDAYSKIWDDEGSDADRDVSIWRPISYQSGFYPVGDVAVATHDRPKSVALLVRSLKSGSLKKPTGFTEIWSDTGSDADSDVRIFKMKAPDGYTCLGNVAINSYSRLPDLNKYRCIKSAYVTSGSYEPIWKDTGSDADDDVGLWSDTEIDNPAAIYSNTFTSVKSHKTPSGRPALLSGAYAELYSLITISNTDDLAITLYEGTDLEKVWDDEGSDADDDVSVWRAEGPSKYYSLGDIAVKSHRKPRKSIIAKAMKDDVLQAPTDYRKIWDDTGSDADDDVSFWQPICPYNYRPLGHAAIRRHSKQPSKNDIRCVNKKYTTKGEWKKIWDDDGSGADDDVTIWQAEASGEKGQGVIAMSTRASHGSMKQDAYVLDAAQINYIVGKPAKKYILQNVQYLFDDRDILNQEPEALARTILENRGSTAQSVRRTLTYTYTETYSWSNTVGSEVGVETEIKSGVPFLAEGKVKVSVKTSYSHTWGSSESETKSDSVLVMVEVQPHSQKSALVTSNRYIMDIPYTATLITEYADGSTGVRENYEGVYEGVQVNEVRIIYEEDIPLSP